MKKRVSIFIVLILVCGAMLSACSTTASKSATFDVDTGDRIKISVNAKAGYDLTMEVPFAITKDGDAVLNGSFTYAEYYDVYRQVIDEDANATLIEEGNKDGNDYFFYTFEGNAGTESDYVMMVGGSQTAILMGSLAETSEVQAAFEAMTVSLE